MNDYKLRYYVGGAKLEVSFAHEGTFEFPHFSVTAGVNGDRHTVTVTAKCDIKTEKCTLRGVAHADVGQLCFVNGYQSWTKTKEFYMSEKERDAKRIFKPLNRIYAFDRYGDATFFDYNKNILHGYDVFFVKAKDGAFILNANYKNAYLVVVLDKSTGEISLRNELDNLKLTVGQTFTVSDYYQVKGYDKGMRLFNEVFPQKPTKKLLGYTSWYNYYQNITEDIILRDLDALDDRFDLFQIDDGYETFVGDWMDVDKKKFPHGLKGIVEKIHEKGFMAGVWLAPFVAEKNSRVFKDHPDWFNIGGEQVLCGANWSGFYSLDLTKEPVKRYITACLQYFIDLGFDFFKLDFLYGANLPAYDGITRSMAAENAYSFIREVLDGKIILGCGATLFNSADRFEYLRIGPDVSLKFDDVWYMRFMHNERISTKTTLQNTIYRSFMNDRMFGNDPDVFLLRDNNISLSESQKKALLTINALFGSLLMTSDNIADYDDKKRDTLNDALEIFRNAKVTSFERTHDIITVHYTAVGKDQTIKYDTKRGILV